MEQKTIKNSNKLLNNLEPKDITDNNEKLEADKASGTQLFTKIQTQDVLKLEDIVINFDDVFSPKNIKEGTDLVKFEPKTVDEVAELNGWSKNYCTNLVSKIIEKITNEDALEQHKVSLTLLTILLFKGNRERKSNNRTHLFNCCCFWIGKRLLHQSGQ